MTNEEVLTNHEKRIQTLEEDIKDLQKDFISFKDGVDKRLDVVEKEQINLKTAVDKLSTKVDRLANSLTTALDKVKKAIILIGAVAIVGIVVTIVNDSTTKQEIIGAITNITGAVIH